MVLAVLATEGVAVQAGVGRWGPEADALLRYSRRPGFRRA